MDDDMDDHPEPRDGAVVLGAGVAGLLAARVLAERFDRVTVVERDELPDSGPAFRPGVPQSRHAHVLWSKGVDLIEDLLPGTTARLLAGGAVLLDLPRDFLWLSPADWFLPVHGARALLGSRELLDRTLRGQVLRDARIRVRARCTATGLVAAADGRSVAGVELRSGERLPARLVVDATGRTSRAPDWLAALGHPVPATTRYDSRLGYSSRSYAVPPDPARRWRGMYVQGRPDSPRGGVLVPLRATGGWRRSSATATTPRPPRRRSSSASPAACAAPPCTTPSATRSPCPRRSASATPRTNAATTSAWSTHPTASWSSATRPAASTPCTGTG